MYSITSNSAFSLLSQIIPMIVAIFCIPLTLYNLGNENYGFFTLGWALVGYLKLSGFGFSPATTKLISELQLENNQDYNTVHSIIWTAIKSQILFSIFFCGFFIILINIYIDELLIKNQFNSEDIKNMFYFFIFQVPILVLSNTLKGSLEAIKKFFTLMNIKIIIYSLYSIVPLVLSIYDSNLTNISIALFIVEFLNMSILLYFNVKHLQIHKGVSSFSKIQFNRMVIFGGWISLYSILNPIFMNMDRFIVSLYIPTIQIPYYTVTQDLIIQYSAISASIMVVLFPYFVNNVGKSKNINFNILNNIIVIMVYFSLITLSIISLIGKELLEIWVDFNFSENAFNVSLIFFIGIAVKSSFILPMFTYTQAYNRPDLLPKALLFLLLPYYFVFNYIGRYSDIFIFSIVWTTQIIVEFILLLLLMKKYLSFKFPIFIYKKFLVIFIITLFYHYILSLLISFTSILLIRIIIILIITTILTILSYNRLIDTTLFSNQTGTVI